MAGLLVLGALGVATVVMTLGTELTVVEGVETTVLVLGTELTVVEVAAVTATLAVDTEALPEPKDSSRWEELKYLDFRQWWFLILLHSKPVFLSRRTDTPNFSPQRHWKYADSFWTINPTPSIKALPSAVRWQ
jgi:hypothetical protein